MEKIRLEKSELEILQKLFKKYFLPTDKLWIFGSRADAKKKGGDIDLLLITEHPEPAEKLAENKYKILAAIKNILGDQTPLVAQHMIQAALFGLPEKQMNQLQAEIVDEEPQYLS